MELLILAGGKATRLSSVLSEKPKLLAGNPPFLATLLNAVTSDGTVTRLVFSLGHLGEVVVDWLQRNPPKIPFQCVLEKEPMGTGGAIQLCARDALKGPRFFVLNGDCLFRFPFKQMVTAHEKSGSLATIAVIPDQDASRFGSIELKGEKISQFKEKEITGRLGPINSGLYLMDRQCVNEPPRPCSVERDIFPNLARSGQLGACLCPSPFLDIGVPDSLAQLPSFAESLR